jgi:hypothetical protein
MHGSFCGFILSSLCGTRPDRAQRAFAADQRHGARQGRLPARAACGAQGHQMLGPVVGMRVRRPAIGVLDGREAEKV